MRSRHDLDASFGDYTFGKDRSREQHRFLRAVEVETPEVLENLRERVLKLYRATNRRHRSEEAFTRCREAIWDWACHSSLVPETELALLKTPRAFSIASEMETDFMYRWVPIDYEPFSANSVALRFALGTLFRVVSRTLKSWSRPADAGSLRWTFPPQDPTIYDTTSEEVLARVSQEWEEDELINSTV
ncbi:MAG TPA: hypothetical protein VHR66_14050 [Gemmataceae bacterium]|jgi:hypothetical protein|nr:hypothetical protein [Gemmataceae bacterium]